MVYRIVLHRLAERDLDEAYQWASRNAPSAAARWLARFQQALGTLDHNPQRCSRAREDEKSDLELHQFLFGKRPNVFRVIFTIQDDFVHILRIRRAQRRFLTKPEIRDMETELGDDEQ
jgi:plasmid stabilization system protein ParE